MGRQIFVQSNGLVPSATPSHWAGSMLQMEVCLSIPSFLSLVSAD